MSQSRREFLQKAAAVSAPLVVPALAAAPERKAPESETLVKTLHDSLSGAQRKQLCFSFDHPLRSKVDNNWHITKSRVEDLTGDQQAMVKEIFMGLHSPEYAQKVFDQVEWDSGLAGFESSSIALFGEPGTGKFEFVLTGRHCTRRCDGDSVEGAAFGGPIFYGHAAKSFNEGPAHEGNVYWFQALRANEVFQMLDGKQREQALCDKSRREKGTETVALTGKTRGLDGIRVGDLAADQKNHVRKVMADLLAPFRRKDATEAMKLVEAAGFDHLHLAFYRNQDIGNDKVWDVWQIEGPAMLWFFRGKPHVHTWVHIRDRG